MFKLIVFAVFWALGVILGYEIVQGSTIPWVMAYGVLVYFLAVMISDFLCE